MAYQNDFIQIKNSNGAAQQMTLAQYSTMLSNAVRAGQLPPGAAQQLWNNACWMVDARKSGNVGAMKQLLNATHRLVNAVNFQQGAN